MSPRRVSNRSLLSGKYRERAARHGFVIVGADGRERFVGGDDALPQALRDALVALAADGVPPLAVVRCYVATGPREQHVAGRYGALVANYLRNPSGRIVTLSGPSASTFAHA